MTTTSTLSSNTAQTAPADTAAFIPIDLQGNAISDEGNPAYLAGALAAALECYERNFVVKTFVERRMIVEGHRTIVDSKDAVGFAENIIQAPETYGVRNICPPTPAIITAFNAAAIQKSLGGTASPSHASLAAVAATAAALQEAGSQYTANKLAIAAFDNKICKALSHIIQDSTTRLRLVSGSGGSTKELVRLIEAEAAKLTSGDRTAAKNSYNDFIRDGYSGEMELEPFNLHILEMKRQIQRLPPADRALVNIRQEIEDLINVADEELAYLLRISKIATPPTTDEAHLEIIRGLLRDRATNSTLRSIRGKSPSSGTGSKAQVVLLATSLRNAGVNSESDARKALSTAGLAGGSLESALAVWSTTKDPNKQSGGKGGG